MTGTQLKIRVETAGGSYCLKNVEVTLYQSNSLWGCKVCVIAG